MDKILNLDSVDLYNKLYGLETLNPLVSVIDLNKATSRSHPLQLRHLCAVSKTRESLRYQIRTPDIRLPRRHDRLLRPRANSGNKPDHR